VKRVFLVGLLVVQTGCAAMAATSAEESSAFMSVEEVVAACGTAPACGAPGVCEGQIVKVKGYIDYGNVFDKEHYPQLPYEKFTIRGSSGKAVEVWVRPEHSREVFRQIHRQTSTPEKMVFLEGEIAGVDMPILGTCQRGIKINLTSAETFFVR
jgi:hypothetical protein